MNFPIYRKYKNGLSYFKIISETEFYEVKINGSRYELIHIHAKIHPDRVLIADMLNNYNNYWDTCSAEEYIRAAKAA